MFPALLDLFLGSGKMYDIRTIINDMKDYGSRVKMNYNKIIIIYIKFYISIEG